MLPALLARCSHAAPGCFLAEDKVSLSGPNPGLLLEARPRHESAAATHSPLAGLRPSQMDPAGRDRRSRPFLCKLLMLLRDSQAACRTRVQDHGKTL